MESYVARNALFAQYSYLCKRGSRKFFRGTFDRSDLEQTAAIGLLKACDRFEESEGTPFEAYAWRLVVGELMHYVRDFERPVRIPRNLRTLDASYIEVESRLTSRLARLPHVAEVAREMNVSITLADELRVLHGGPLVVPLEAASTPTIDMRVERAFARTHGAIDDDRSLIDVLDTLTREERIVVRCTFDEGLPQRTIGERMGLRQRQVSRILARARKKLARVAR